MTIRKAFPVSLEAPLQYHARAPLALGLNGEPITARKQGSFMLGMQSENLSMGASGSTLWRRVLYAVCVLTDFAAFVVVFTVSRGLAEAGAASWYLGFVGAGLSFCSGVASIAAGWLSGRLNGSAVFLSGAAMIAASTLLCRAIAVSSSWFPPGYWLLGLGLGFLYPPLIGWLNQGEDPHANRRGVSRTLILFCIAWNLGMMGGQLTAGALYSAGINLAYGAALAVCLLNLALAVVAARLVSLRACANVAASRQENPRVALAAGFKRLSWIANLGGMFGGSMVIHLLPALAVSLGVPAEEHGTLLAAWRGVIILTYLVLHFSEYWHYRMSAAIASQVMAIAGLLLIAQAQSAFGLLLGLALLGQLVGYNYFAGLYYSAAGSDNSKRALAAGIHEATLAAGMAVGTILGGALGSVIDQRMPYRMAAVVVLVLMTAQCAAWVRWVLPLREGRTAAGEPLFEPMRD
jgi:MFS family permease